jgi:hypothetical protein
MTGSLKRARVYTTTIYYIHGEKKEVKEEYTYTYIHVVCPTHKICQSEVGESSDVVMETEESAPSTPEHLKILLPLAQ